ncbi:hypothetical protein C8Q74DRAFT_1305949 [Fomes fomentarius]|nr:hypothetical protein C8Q74DRAFT_1305949 [Fomes fomentarius]
MEGTQCLVYRPGTTVHRSLHTHSAVSSPTSSTRHLPFIHTACVSDPVVLTVPT